MVGLPLFLIEVRTYRLPIPRTTREVIVKELFVVISEKLPGALFVSHTVPPWVTTEQSLRFPTLSLRDRAGIPHPKSDLKPSGNIIGFRILTHFLSRQLLGQRPDYYVFKTY